MYNSSSSSFPLVQKVFRSFAHAFTCKIGDSQQYRGHFFKTMGKEKKRKVPLKQKNFICISHIMRQRHHTEIPDVERTWFEHMSDLRGYVTFKKQHSIQSPSISSKAFSSPLDSLRISSHQGLKFIRANSKDTLLPLD